MRALIKHITQAQLRIAQDTLEEIARVCWHFYAPCEAIIPRAPKIWSRRSQNYGF